ncbi:MAG: TRAP transporter small permease [Alphaproteobacteria bacterium]|nr:TRAP transporter small permease [Alphaproteobacteria bacterium]
MAAVDRALDRLVRGLQGVALALTFVMMLLTLADVIGRYFLEAPIRGAYEVTQILLATVIFAGLPLATAHRQHIVIDLLDAFVPAGAKRLQSNAVDLITTVVLGCMAFAVWQQAGRTAKADVQTDILRIPLAPVVYFVAAMCAAACVAILLRMALARPVRDRR